MKINDDGSGQRMISCVITKSELNKKVNGGETVLNDFLNDNCPQQLTWDSEDTPSRIKYNFYLDYKDLSDYRNKINSLLYKNTDIIFSTPNNIFAKGFNIKEDFTSEELMAWLNNGLTSQKLMQAGESLWSYDKNYILYKGDTYETSSNINEVYIDYIPIDKINIYTEISESYTPLTRNVDFCISNEAYNKLGDTVIEYMNTLVPYNATGTWSENNNQKIFTIKFSASTMDELNECMNKILDTNQNNATLEQTTSNDITNTKEFNEKLDFSSFPSNKQDTTYVNYIFKPLPKGIQVAKTYEDFQYRDISQYIDNNIFSISEDINHFNIVLEQKTQIPISTISLETKLLNSGNTNKNIIILFNSDDDIASVNKVKEKLQNLNIQNMFVSTYENKCEISINGSTKEVNTALKELLGEGNEITISSTDDFSLYNTYSSTEKIDMAKFCDELGYNGQIDYTFTSYNNIDEYTTSANQYDQSISYTADSKQITTMLPLSQSNIITSNSYIINSTFVLVIVISIIILIFILVLVIYLIIRNTKKNINYAINDDTSSQIPQFLYSGYVCPNCHYPLYLGMDYCVNCGKKIIQEEKNNKQ